MDPEMECPICYDAMEPETTSPPCKQCRHVVCTTCARAMRKHRNHACPFCRMRSLCTQRQRRLRVLTTVTRARIGDNHPLAAPLSGLVHLALLAIWFFAYDF